MGETPRHNTRPWTSLELKTLRTHAHEGATALATRLNRSTTAVRKAAQRHRISLRRTGSRAGILLGQPRGTSWADARNHGILSATMTAAIEADIRDGRINPTDVEAQLRAVAEGTHQNLCTACATRPARPNGFCRVCHLNALAEAHRTAAAETRAQQDLWQARQDKKRRKDA